MYTLYMLQGLAPFVGGLCLENFITRQGELCNVRDYPPNVVKYDKPNPEHACYRDGIFYPRCKDLENPEVWHYHNLLKNP
jgi:hypothetical protein